MGNSLNSPVSYIVKITSQIPVYLEIEDLFPIGKTAQKFKKKWLKNRISDPKTSKTITSKN